MLAVEADQLPPRTAADAASLLSPQNIVIAIILAGALLLAWGYRRSLAARAPAAKPAAEDSELASIRADMQEFTDRLAAELDRKAADLERLMAQAEEKIEQLESARRAAALAAPASHTIEPRPQTAPPTPAADPSHLRIYQLADAGMTPVEIARKVERGTGEVEVVLALRRGVRAGPGL